MVMIELLVYCEIQEIPTGDAPRVDMVCMIWYWMIMVGIGIILVLSCFFV